jgi:hypothetical protein
MLAAMDPLPIHSERGGLDESPPGWEGTDHGLPWRRLPVERRARVWAAFIGVDVDAVVPALRSLASDRDALAHLVHVVADRRVHLAVAGAPTAEADALLSKLRWELAALGAAVPDRAAG